MCEESKICPKCNTSKPLSNFSKSKSRKDGYSCYCKACMKECFTRLKEKPKVTPDTKLCKVCEKTKPSSAFGVAKKSLDGLYYQCRECNKLSTASRINKPKVAVIEKACSVCKEVKDASEFATSKYTSDGLRTNCKPCGFAYNQEYAANHKETLLETRKREARKPLTMFRSAIRSRLLYALRSENLLKSNRTLDYLGCSIQEYRDYIESKFQEGMTWDNFGRTGLSEGWVIDHTVPLSYFDIAQESQLLMACHYTNTQPMWDIMNIQKKHKLDWVNELYDSPRDKIAELENLFGYSVIPKLILDETQQPM